MRSMKNWLAGVLGGRTNARRGATTRARLALERLEVRTVPSAGALDPTFGTGGKVLTDFGSFSDNAGSVAVQAAGKIVVAGSAYGGASTGPDFALARYNADGTLDSGFGTGGKVL